MGRLTEFEMRASTTIDRDAWASSLNRHISQGPLQRLRAEVGNAVSANPLPLPPGPPSAHDGPDPPPTARTPVLGSTPSAGGSSFYDLNALQAIVRAVTGSVEGGDSAGEGEGSFSSGGEEEGLEEGGRSRGMASQSSNVSSEPVFAPSGGGLGRPRLGTDSAMVLIGAPPTAEEEGRAVEEV